MKFVFGILFVVLASISSASASVDSFGVIREFGDGDRAALFGWIPQSENVEITGCTAPQFAAEVGCQIGRLNEAVMDHLFLESARPLSSQEKQELLSQWAGAFMLYFEGYQGNFCRNDEMEIDVSVTGRIDGKPVTWTFQFIALPNAVGNCSFLRFGTIVRS